MILISMVQDLIFENDYPSNQKRPFRSGRDFNPSSPPHVKYLCHTFLKLPDTGSGTGKEILRDINLPQTNQVLAVRSLSVLINTFVKKLPNAVTPDSRIHAQFNLEQYEYPRDVLSPSLIEVKKEMGNNIVLSAYMIVKYGNKCWTLYSCNEPKVRNAYGNYLIYKTQVIDAHDEGYKIFDAFGTIGDPKSDKSLVGLHEFKKKFGGEYTEFIGEFDFIQKKLTYFLFTKLVPYYRKFINKRLKKSSLN